MMKKVNVVKYFSQLFLYLAASGMINAQDSVGTARNPIIWADVPDPSVIRIGDAYYMSSTTMHMNPGVPIMKSIDLVNWEIVNYAYDILVNNDAMNLKNGQEAYGDGSWASSIRYHNGTFFVVTFSYTTGKTHIYQTTDIENGPWSSSTLSTVCHDPSLLFDDDGVYIVYGVDDIKIIELNSTATAIKSGGLNRVLIAKASQIAGTNFYVPAEGSHIHKIDGMYYIFLISWPAGSMRTELVYRSDRLTGPYEGKIALRYDGVAQGGLIDTPDGEWYGLLFQDRGSVGRIPYLVPVAWKDGWPVFGVNGRVPAELAIPAANDAMPKIVASDEFDWNSELPLVWQWNHNPDDNYWSVTERPGYFRMTNGRIDSGFLDTQNTLTQRTFGPECSGIVAMDVSHMQDGDVAGLGALQKNYGFVAVKMSGTAKSVVMVNAGSGTAVETANIPLSQDNIYLKMACDFKNKIDRALFYYSLDGLEWTAIGNTLQMSYTLPHFMGYRFSLFNYATVTAGGHVDFDYFRIDDSLTGPSAVDQMDGYVPNGVILYGNYPNPFNPRTQIRYQLAPGTNMSLKVYDLLGREVSTLYEGTRQPGVYETPFDGRDLAGGVYFCRLTTDANFEQTKKMIILK
ncbi:T9SS C-terminal target domain-containing protein [candidate division KSB1 bacterium]|nr:MAG: T9SS C-terminal target domain-containing protein [candidate division KSB1 bacterium]